MTTNAFQIIKHDHQNVDRLFHEIGEADGSEKSALLDALVEELTLHMRAEEEVLYPHLASDEHLHALIVESGVEHSVIVKLTEELHRTARSDELVDAQLAVLKELVQRHVHTEETQVLPRAGLLLHRDVAERLGAEMIACKQRFDHEEDEGVRERRESPPVHIESAAR